MLPRLLVVMALTALAVSVSGDGRADASIHHP